MVQVPAGSFLMGSLRDSSSLGANPAPQPGGDEFPQRSVSLPEFYIDQTEVINEAYDECVNAGVCKRQVGGDPNYHVNPSFDNYPVIYVSWDDAQAYCQWRGKRLPTEAEWEKAARGTDGRVWPWGNTFRDDPSQANLGGNPNRALPVDGRPNGASPYGALDMAGNVAEWVADWYQPTYYTSRPDPDSAPPGPTQADSTNNKVIRGGSFRNQGQEARPADRNGIGLGASFDVGFRCAWSSR
jgi:formylglycine-generating enzyme required for sulfatase activity